jgi:flagellar hook assembly protein FlgD
MWQNLNKFAVFFLSAFILISLSLTGGPDKPLKNIPLENYTLYNEPTRTMVNVNNISSWIQWDGRCENGINAASGIYFVQMEAANYRKVHKMILVK